MLGKLPYWLTAGILGIFLFVGLFSLAPSDLLVFYAPSLWIVGLDLAMRGTPASFAESAVKLSIGFGIAGIMFFVLGVALAAAIRRTLWKQYWLRIIAGIFAACLFIVAFVIPLWMCLLPRVFGGYDWPLMNALRFCIESRTR